MGISYHPPTMEDEAFLKKFAPLLLLANLNSVYLPGMKFYRKPGLNNSTLMIYSSVWTIISCLSFIDLLTQPIILQLPAIEKATMFFLGFCYAWNSVSRFFYLARGKLIQRIYRSFSNCLHPQVWPELFEENVNKAYRKEIRITYITVGVGIAPVVAAFFVKLFWTRTVFSPSMFETTHPSETSNLVVLTYQFFTILLHNTSWALGEAFLSLLFNILIAEYDYLTTSLRRIVNIIHVDEFGLIYAMENKNTKITNPGQMKPSLEITRKRLALWIGHHEKVIRAMKDLETCFGPLLCGQFLFIIIALCGLIFISLTDSVSQEGIMLNVMYVSARMVMAYRLCRCGDLIAKMSSRLAYEIFSNNWMGFPKDIVKTLLNIGQISQKPVLIKVSGVYPVSSETFRDILYLQFRFLAFIQNIKH